MSTLLRLDGLEVGYGALTAVRDVSLEVGTGEVVALIGANGAGKTTTLKAITGLLLLRRGRMTLDGERLDGLSPARVVGRGTSVVFSVLKRLTGVDLLEDPLRIVLPAGHAGAGEALGRELGESGGEDAAAGALGIAGVRDGRALEASDGRHR